LDAVIKIGGSLLEKPQVLKTLGIELSVLAKKHRFVVVPGGGKFADAVRIMDAQFQMPAVISHRMAILAMDQCGLLLSHVIPESKTSCSLKAVNEIASGGHTAILLPSKILFESDPFKPSWDVTSDSIAAYIAVKVKADMVIFVTDVDGVFTSDPKTDSSARLLSSLSVESLSRFARRTSVDKFLPIFLAENSLDCYVVNGEFPERLAAVLFGQSVIATRILPETNH